MSDEDELINQDDIEKLLNSNGAGSADSADAAEQPEPAATADDAEQPEPAAPDAAAEKPEPAAEQHEPVVPAAAAEDDDKLLGQDDIEKLLNKASEGDPSAATAEQPAQAQPSISSGPAHSNETVQQGDVEYLLDQAQAAIDSITTGPAEPSPHGASQFKLEKFTGVPASTETATLDLIRDVDLDLKIELGRTHMYLEDVLKLNKGSVVPLDKMAGDPVDIYVNGRLIARGEVLVMNDNFCVRVAELIAGEAAG